MVGGWWEGWPGVGDCPLQDLVELKLSVGRETQPDSAGGVQQDREGMGRGVLGGT